MTYTINAWLDKPQPELQLVDRNSGQAVACWRGRRLQELFASGLISYAELLTASAQQLKVIEKALILQMACEELCGRCPYNER